jgi:hypothetical protein
MKQPDNGFIGYENRFIPDTQPKRPGQAPMPQPWLEPCGMYQFLWLQSCTKGKILQLGLSSPEVSVSTVNNLRLGHKGLEIFKRFH